MRPGSRLTRYGTEFMICEPVASLYNSQMVRNVREKGDYFAVNLKTGALTIFQKADVCSESPPLPKGPYLHVKVNSYEWAVALGRATDVVVNIIKECVKMGRRNNEDNHVRVSYMDQCQARWFVDYSPSEKVLEQFYFELTKKLTH